MSTTSPTWATSSAASSALMSSAGTNLMYFFCLHRCQQNTDNHEQHIDLSFSTSPYPAFFFTHPLCYSLCYCPSSSLYCSLYFFIYFFFSVTCHPSLMSYCTDRMRLLLLGTAVCAAGTCCLYVAQMSTAQLQRTRPERRVWHRSRSATSTTPSTPISTSGSRSTLTFLAEPPPRSRRSKCKQGWRL